MKLKLSLILFLSVFLISVTSSYAQTETHLLKEWHEDLMISDDPMHNSLNPILLSDSKGDLHLIYQDQSDGIFSIKYRKGVSGRWSEEIVRLSDELKYARTLWQQSTKMMLFI